MLEKLATGGLGEVWKARMRGVKGFQKIVVIKKILPHLSDNQDFIEMFVDEAKLAAQLNHNNIIHIYDLGKIQRSEEHTSELQSRQYLVCRLLLEKKKKPSLHWSLLTSIYHCAA